MCIEINDCDEKYFREIINNTCICKFGYIERFDYLCIPKCHQSCLTCNGLDHLHCTSCDTNHNRELKGVLEHAGSNRCVCKKGFKENKESFECELKLEIEEL